MKKIILIGRTGSGKTTLMQAINNLSKEYKKTQAIEYFDSVLDTPGEYIENKRYYNALIVSSYDCDVIGLVHDCTDEECIFPPNFAFIFAKPVIGIITKIDCANRNIHWSENCLKRAGAGNIFEISAMNGTGLNELKVFLA
ncbi:MAG: ethanolamine utilization protein EutP [Clostridiales bacterium]|nr:ethanolamine utilization protein EutP [Clostridiales bacterium]MDK2933078.1 ethanolamine utilization protein EutP [Clostridiales bacterium]